MSKWLCKIGIHKWRRVGSNGLIIPMPILECARCAKVRVESLVYDTIYYHDFDSMESFQIEMQKRECERLTR